MTLSTGQNRTNSTQNSKCINNVWDIHHDPKHWSTNSTQNSKYINVWDIHHDPKHWRTNLTQNSKYINVWDIHHDPKHWAEPHIFNPEQ